MACMSLFPVTAYMYMYKWSPTHIQIQSGRFKTGLCPNLSRPEGCPRGDKCTYAHTEEERELYRSLSKGTKPPKARTEPVKMCGASSRIGQGTRGRHSGDFGPPISDLPMYSYIPSQQVGVTPIAREPHYLRQGSGEGSFDSGPLSGGFPFTGKLHVHNYYVYNPFVLHGLHLYFCDSANFVNCVRYVGWRWDFINITVLFAAF